MQHELLPHVWVFSGWSQMISWCSCLIICHITAELMLYFLCGWRKRLLRQVPAGPRLLAAAWLLFFFFFFTSAQKASLEMRQTKTKMQQDDTWRWYPTSRSRLVTRLSLWSIRQQNKTHLLFLKQTSGSFWSWTHVSLKERWILIWCTKTHLFREL